jgi:hypothetical protein
MCAIVFVFLKKKMFIVHCTKYQVPNVPSYFILCYYVSLAIRYIHGDIVSCVVKT